MVQISMAFTICICFGKAADAGHKLAKTFGGVVLDIHAGRDPLGACDLLMFRQQAVQFFFGYFILELGGSETVWK